jgi:hypothetical protein
MRVLLDEQLPRHLAREIVGHDISTVQQEPMSKEPTTKEKK